jgi:protein-S-isoprenylcysteine O-methyltransferase Ste14
MEERAEMLSKKELAVFLEKVPALRKPGVALLTVLYVLVLIAACILFFHLFHRIGGYAPLLGQLLMAAVTVFLDYLHLRSAGAYRRKYGSLAYQAHFYHLMLPILIAWYACCFHPLFIGGPPLLPAWLAVGLGILALIPVPLSALHIEASGFHMMTHGMDIFTVFPEETPAVRGAIYGHIRHPLYFSLVCITFSLALFRNTPAAILSAAILLPLSLVTGYLEDRELIGRYGDAHREYIRGTSALFPFMHPWRFLRLLFFLDKPADKKTPSCSNPC